jgi:hypothetical protein
MYNWDGSSHHTRDRISCTSWFDHHTRDRINCTSWFGHHTRDRINCTCWFDHHTRDRINCNCLIWDFVCVSLLSYFFLMFPLFCCFLNEISLWYFNINFVFAFAFCFCYIVTWVAFCLSLDNENLPRCLGTLCMR